ncbi:MAG TPA: hypothetical protein VGC82_04270, partial [Rhodopila sp.]
EQRFAEVESDPALIPDHAILQTWMPYPTHMLPETQPGTMTWLVNRYRTAQTRLDLHRTGDRLQGTVTDTAGQPLAGAPVTLSADLPSESGAPIAHTRSGHVPPKAASALVALRINAECNCSGPADIAIAPMRFHNDRTNETVQRAFQPAKPNTNAEPSRFQAQPGQSVTQNTPAFPVTADDPFTIQVPMRTDLASAGSGYVALIFLNAAGKEIMRLRLPFDPVQRPIGTLTTDAHGGFSLLPDPATLRASVGFHAEFPGDPQHRTASATIR